MNNPSPIVVCGIGGSGTRLVANILERHNVYMGDLHNPARDCLLFNFWMYCQRPGNRSRNLYYLKLFSKSYFYHWTEEDVREAKRKWVDIKENNSSHSKNLRRAFEKLSKIFDVQLNSTVFGWKAPRSLLFLPEIFELYPLAKVIYVYRHPLDMAFSKNQRQLGLYADFFNINNNRSPANSLKYWLAIDQYLDGLSERYKIHRISFEKLCCRDYSELFSLENFVDFKLKDHIVNDLVETPESIGRWMEHGKDCFDVSDIEKVYRLGFDIG
ncbi:sulfotransferase [Amphritea sp.]|uniref:sulfotransferase n=1 Tax=Amphritea sp. TaxID=1872502 RepID=UPI003D1019EE